MATVSWLEVFAVWTACNFLGVDGYLNGLDEIVYNCPSLDPTLYTPSCTDGPAMRACEPTELNIVFIPYRFLGIDDPAETMSISGNIRVVWYVPCPRLVTLAPKVVTVMDSTSMWDPFIFHANMASHNAVRQRRLMTLLPNVTFNLELKTQQIGVYVSMCDTFDYTYFPIDSQHCAVRFNAPYYADTVRMVIDPAQDGFLRGIADAFVSPGHEWFYLNASYVTFVEAGRWNAVFSFYYKRKPTYYIYTSLLPVLLMTALQVTAFFICPKGSERAMFNVTLLLALTLINSHILSMVPVKPERIFLTNYTDLATLFSWGCTLYSIVIGWIVHKKWKCTKRPVVFFGIVYSVGEMIDILVCCFAIIIFLSINCYALAIFVANA